MQQVLDIYPKVKGIQVMNDMGAVHVLAATRASGSRTPRRGAEAILDRLRGWNAVQQQQPGRGHRRAPSAPSPRPDKKISIYVFGDEFTGDSIDEVLKTVDRINSRTAAASAACASTPSAFR